MKNPNILLQVKKDKKQIIFKKKFIFLENLFNKIRDIIELDFELSDDFYSLEENKYFYVYYKTLKK